MTLQEILKEKVKHYFTEVVPKKIEEAIGYLTNRCHINANIGKSELRIEFNENEDLQLMSDEQGIREAVRDHFIKEKVKVTITGTYIHLNW